MENVLVPCAYSPTYVVKDFPIARYQGLQFVSVSLARGITGGWRGCTEAEGSEVSNRPRKWYCPLPSLYKDFFPSWATKAVSLSPCPRGRGIRIQHTLPSSCQLTLTNSSHLPVVWAS